MEKGGTPTMARMPHMKKKDVQGMTVSMPLTFPIFPLWYFKKTLPAVKNKSDLASA